jgi:hypothetical protein
MKRDLQKYLPVCLLLVLAVLIGMAFFLLAETVPGIADTMGYVYAAERLAAGDGLSLDDPNNMSIGPVFSMFAFQIRWTNDSRMFLGFPPGFPALLSLGIILTEKMNAVPSWCPSCRFWA